MKNTKNLKHLAVKLFFFTLPITLLITLSVVFDPFRVYWKYDDYYKNTFITLNREFICFRLYERNSKNIRYNSFIFGSSRSNAFRVKDWERFLPPNSKGFHFDGYSEGIYGILNKIRYIDETGGEIKNALIVVDNEVLYKTNNRKGYTLISPPELSKESSVHFYVEFLKPWSNLKFVIGYIDYSIFGTYRDYMKHSFRKQRYEDISDNLTGDLYYGYDRMISENKERYYGDLIKEGVFYNRSKRAIKNEPIKMKQRELLTKIKEYLDKHRTDYRVVISPLYDQVPLGDDYIQLLQDVFGAGKVYNYSGVNKYTESIYNYYEESHFIPRVANEIMKEIYLNPRSKK